MKRIRKILGVLLLCIMTLGLTLAVYPQLDSSEEVWAAETVAQPKGLTAKVSSTSSITISWEAVEGADGYRIYRKTASTKWTKIKNIKSPDIVSYKNKKCVPGTVYYYTIRSYKLVEDGKVWSAYDKKGVSARILAAPEKVKAYATDDGKIELEWKPVEGAEGYQIIRTPAGGDWEDVTGVGGSSYIDNEEIIPGVTYTYTIRASFTQDGKTVLGAYDSDAFVVTAKMPIPQPVSVKATSASEAVFTWERVFEAEGYRVYRRTAGGKWAKLANIKGNTTVSYKDTSVELGTKYYYTVRAYKYVDGVKLWSGYNKSGKKLTMSIPAPTLVSAKISGSAKVVVKWQAIEGVYGYRVYRYNSATAKWDRLSTLTGENITSYTDTTVDIGRTYRYTVRAYVKQNGSNKWGLYNKTGISVKVVLPAPKLVSAVPAGGSSIVLTWKPVEGADGYRVYVNGAGWERVATLSGQDKSTYTVTGLEPEATYQFTVRAYKKVGTTKNWGKYSKDGITATTTRGTLKLNETELLLLKGYSRELELEGTSQSPIWSSSDSTVVSVTEYGRIYGVKKGTAVITAMFEGIEYQCKVTVEAPYLSAKDIVLDVGESVEVSLEGTTQDISWAMNESYKDHASLTTIDENTVKITALKPGDFVVFASVGIYVDLYSLDAFVKGNIDVSQSNISITVGKTVEVILESDYSLDDLDISYNDTSIINVETERIEEGKWKLKIQGLSPGSLDVVIQENSYQGIAKESITVTVKDSTSVEASQFKLKRYIKNNGVMSEGIPVVAYTGYFEGYEDEIYSWAIGYGEDEDMFGFALTMDNGAEQAAIMMDVNIEKSSTIRPVFVYAYEAGGQLCTAQVTISAGTYTGQDVAFTIVESEGLSSSELTQIKAFANDFMRLAFEGWNEYILKKAGVNLQNLGFKLYSVVSGE